MDPDLGPSPDPDLRLLLKEAEFLIRVVNSHPCDMYMHLSKAKEIDVLFYFG